MTKQSDQKVRLTKITEQPTIINHPNKYKMRPYQIEGLNWMVRLVRMHSKMHYIVVFKLVVIVLDTYRTTVASMACWLMRWAWGKRVRPSHWYAPFENEPKIIWLAPFPLVVHFYFVSSWRIFVNPEGSVVLILLLCRSRPWGTGAVSCAIGVA